jgi:hypothetical protein
MQAHIGHALEPDRALVIEIRLIQERAAVDEIAAHVRSPGSAEPSKTCSDRGIRA